jgi:membrane-associated phospholipid phosphatase
MIAAVIGLALGTIYGRFHYISDVIAGGIVGFVVIWLTLIFYPREKDTAQEQILSDYDLKRDYVSNHI